MKVLVYGAGVLGSYLAHELYCGQNSVTMLARGKRYEDLKKHGLVMWHIRQKNKTVEPIQVVDRLAPEDAYDIIFVVMQKSQLVRVLPILAENTASKMIVLMGNNAEADKTYESFMQMSTAKPTLLFGFLNCGGSRKEEVIYNWHGDRCGIIIGSPDKQTQFEDTIHTVLEKTNLQLEVKTDMNAWLKYHSALIVPMCIAIQYEGGAKGKYLQSEMLRLSIEAVKETISMFQSKGFCLDAPHDMTLLKWPTKLIQWILAVFLPTKTGKAIAIDHAMVATGEIDLLTRELLACAEAYQYPLPNLKKISEIHQQKEAEH